ncbi:FAD-dependent monooxygenase [Kitasatospora sp. NPDC096077]|uniref:FAD-dependent monooxygenase n=1 Tax=Kitasatospora sp. NPDC096077 TaxID=3155544 RepID=UPI0033312EEB
MDAQVVVVGAGPVGLLLAAELRLGGVETVVLERLAAPSTASRASTLHARTMEFFDQRGLAAELGTPPNDGAGHFGGLPLDLGGLDTRYPGQWKVLQARTEELLHARATDLGARILRGHLVTGLRQHPDHVEVEAQGPAGPVRLQAAYLVGCDGEESTVRQLAGIDFPGAAADKELLRADVDGIDIPGRRFERFPTGMAVAARRPDGVTRVMVHEFAFRPAPRTGPPAFAEVAAAWARVTGEAIGHGTPLWVNAFDNTCRQAARYRLGRVLLAGDAAHQQMPVGGQALNLGLQDAANLGWKLAAEVRGRAPAGLLDSYHDERHPVAERVLTGITAQSHLLLGGAEVDGLRAVFAELLTLDGVAEHLASGIAGLDVRYPLGPGDHPLLGARLPGFELATGPQRGDVLRLLRTGRGLLLALSGDEDRTARLAAELRPWAGRVDLAAGWPGHGTGADLAGHDLLVRPDGHVVWADTSGALGPALLRWFGAPTGD